MSDEGRHAPARPLRRITLHPPEVRGGTASFAFDIEPSSTLYGATRFSLTFPPEVGIAGLPDRLWWTVFLLCLHSQWPYLAPCQVRLPVRLSPGEREFWRRLVSSYVDTLEAYRSGDSPGRAIEIVDGGGPPLPPFAPLPDAGWCATAFSGGKDSLVQTGLLAELTARPILVTTTSPRPDIAEQATARRREVLSEIVRRRDVTLVEVVSDFRATWLNNHFPHHVGYPVSINETTDTFLYLAAMLVVGMALGATRLFLASETELQESVERDGRMIQHHHFMYSAATQRALSAWLAPAGVAHGALTWPLYSAQVLELLWTRYRDLADLEYSCFNVTVDQAMCSRCGQCFRIALGILAAGGDPERIGIDLPTVLEANLGWKPSWPAPPDADPRGRVREHLHAAVIRSTRGASPARILGRVLAGGPGRLFERRTWTAVAGYARLRRGLRAIHVDPPGYRAGFLRLVDPRLRSGLAAIYADHFPAAPDASHAALVARSETLTRWIAAPLAA